MGFNVQKVTEDLVKWTRDWFEQNGPGCNAVVGIDIDYETVGQSGSMLMVTCSGTGVVL